MPFFYFFVDKLNFKVYDVASFKQTENKTMKNGVIQVGKKFEAYHNDVLLMTSYNLRSAEIAYEKATGTYVEHRGRKKVAEVKPELPLKTINHFPHNTQKFHINERFDFLEKAVKMVADKVQPSIIVAGSGGLGKSYTVRKTLEDSGLVDMSMYTDENGMGYDGGDAFVFIKGFSTPKALYRSLWANNNSVIVYDDTDAVLKNETAVNLLKAALDSYDKRIISWGSELRGDDDLPQRFEFTGQIIFITNMDTKNVSQALISRSLVIDLSMTRSETCDRMREILKASSFLPEYNRSVKNDSMDFIERNKDVAKDLSLRTLISVCKIRAEFPTDWEQMAEYITCR